MGYESTMRCVTLLSAADFSTTGQFRFGTVDSSGTVGLTSAAGRVDGVIQDNVAAARATAVCYSGVSMVELGGTVTAGDSVQSGASGVAVTGTTNARAIALEGGVSGDIVPVLLLG